MPTEDDCCAGMLPCQGGFGSWWIGWFVVGGMYGRHEV
jgi:hypothetical protein